MTVPKRIQRRRTKGWKMPENTVCVTRPGKFGNPFKTAEEFAHALRVVLSRGEFKADLGQIQDMLRIGRDLEELRGKNLACFCPLDRSCHADILLELANR